MEQGGAGSFDLRCFSGLYGQSWWNSLGRSRVEQFDIMALLTDWFAAITSCSDYLCRSHSALHPWLNSDENRLHVRRVRFARNRTDQFPGCTTTGAAANKLACHRRSSPPVLQGPPAEASSWPRNSPEPGRASTGQSYRLKK